MSMLLREGGLINLSRNDFDRASKKEFVLGCPGQINQTIPRVLSHLYRGAHYSCHKPQFANKFL